VDNKQPILVIGGSGYIGQNLVKKSANKFHVSWTYYRNRREGIPGNSFRLDIRDPRAVEDLIWEIKPYVIFHLAYDRKNLYESIVIGTRNVLTAYKGLNTKFFFLSTDSVFDGEGSWYKEEDAPRPIFEYGRTKYDAEKTVLDDGGVVIRTSLVYGFKPFDPRIDELLRGLRTSRFSYAYFKDEYRCPIFVDDLCEALLELTAIDPPQVLHLAGPERLSRYDFAVKFAESFGFDARKIPGGSLEGIGLVRPKDVSLSTLLAKSLLKTKLRAFTEVSGNKVSVQVV